MNSEEEKYMLRCIQLAQNGLCNTAPNPMVGAVIVCDGKIIGRVRTMAKLLLVQPSSSRSRFHASSSGAGTLSLRLRAGAYRN